MTQAEARAVLVTAFRALSEEQRANLLWHYEKKTPICCGKQAGLYYDGAGGACPAALALGRGPVNTDPEKRNADEANVFWVFELTTRAEYYDALKTATQRTVRAAIKEASGG